MEVAPPDVDDDRSTASFSDDDAAAGGEAADILIDAATAAAFAEADDLLAAPLVAADIDAAAAAASIEELLAETRGAPLVRGADPYGGHCLRAARDIVAGEVVLEEAAAAWCLCRSPGADGVYTMTHGADDGSIVAALPPWSALRTIRDTLTLAPSYAGRGAAAWRHLSLLSTAEGPGERAAWLSAPALPPGVPPASPSGCDNAVPLRAQLLAAVARANAFAAALPPGDGSAWKRGLLWPALCRLREPADRERLFDDADPLSHVTAFFPLAARINHACGAAANLAHTCVWAEGAPAPLLRIVATRGIPAGSELTQHYLDDGGGSTDGGGGVGGHGGGDGRGGGGAAADGMEQRSLEARRRQLLLTYRFRCACATCASEDAAVGGPADGLARHFAAGTGAGGVAAYFAAGGVYPPAACE